MAYIRIRNKIIETNKVPKRNDRSECCLFLRLSRTKEHNLEIRVLTFKSKEEFLFRGL